MSQLSDNKKSDVASALKLFKEGDTVRARILTVDAEKRRVNFGLKPSYFVDDAAAAASDDEEDEDVAKGEDSTDNASEIDQDADADGAELGSDDEDDADEPADDNDVDMLDGVNDDDDSSSEDEDGDGDVSRFNWLYVWCLPFCIRSQWAKLPHPRQHLYRRPCCNSGEASSGTLKASMSTDQYLTGPQPERTPTTRTEHQRAERRKRSMKSRKT